MATTTFKGDVRVTGQITSGASGTGNQVTLTANTVLEEKKHAGKMLLLSSATGLTATLPAATGSGRGYRFLVATALSSNNYVIQVTGNDIIVGQVTITLAAGGTTFGESAGGTDDTLTMNGTTSGGIVGSYVVFTDYALDTWLLDARLLGSGTLATTGLLTANVT